MIDLHQDLVIPAIATLASIAGGAIGFLLAQSRPPAITVHEQPLIAPLEQVQPPQTEISTLEFKHRLMRWRDHFHIELEKVVTNQLMEIDDALSEKSTWWAIFSMKSASEAVDEVLSAALLEISSSADRLMNQLVEERGVSVVVKDVYKYDPAPLLISLDRIRFFPSNREAIRETIRSEFIGVNGVLSHYVSQSNELIKKACALL